MGLFCRCPYTPPVDTMIYIPLPDGLLAYIILSVFVIVWAIMFIIAIWNMD